MLKEVREESLTWRILKTELGDIYASIPLEACIQNLSTTKHSELLYDLE